MTIEKEHCDVLVIGGGIAALCAAISARDSGASVTLLNKGITGQSGSSPKAAGILAAPFLVMVTLNSALGTMMLIYTHQMFYELVKIFGEETGVPVLLNTSFNVNGEPIVETPTDAIKCFVKTDIDALLIGDNILVKSGIDKNIYK